MQRLKEFYEKESSTGILLMLVTVAALLLKNSPLAELYNGFLHTPVAVQFGALKIAKPLLLWINDGLMAVFFLLVGLEVKRELIRGNLSSWNQAALPVIAATSAANASANPSGAFSPVPTAVPPCARRSSRGSVASTRSMP